MKIIYLIPGPMGRTEAGRTEVERRHQLLQKYAAEGTEVGITDVDRGPASIESMYEEYLAIPNALERAVALERAGWDAIINGCFGDPGIDGAREVLSIPMIGPCEASLLMACSLGHRASIITITQSAVSMTEKQIRGYGLSERLASVRAVDIPVLELHKNRDSTIAAVERAGKAAIEEDGADTLILGCMSMGFLEVAEEVSPKLGVPVLNPARTALKFAEAQLSAGLTHSKRAYMTPPKLEADSSLRTEDLYHVKTER